MLAARLLIDPIGSGTWNMGVDQALLESADTSGILTVRFYSWEPTLSLGYFQPLNSRREHTSSLNCPLVRRSTGGGAILHDQEITYSLSIPSENRWAKRHEQLYWTMHRCIVQVLKELQVEASLFADPVTEPVPAISKNRKGDTGVPISKPDVGPGCGSLSIDRVSDDGNPFLCFERRSSGDVVLSGYKIVGSAQRRNRNAILQHGSLLICRSNFAPELPGFEDLVAIPKLDRNELLKRLVELLAKVLQFEMQDQPMSTPEIERAHHFQQIFESPDWNQKSRKFLF